MSEHPPRQPASGLVDVFTYEHYLIRRKILKLVGGAFHIFDPAGNVVGYSKQAAFKLKEDIRIYTGEDMQREILTIQARQVLDISAVYDVYDPTTQTAVGALKRKGMKSIIKDEWLIMDTQDRERGRIKEDSTMLAVIRRFLTNLIPQKYLGTLDGETVCLFKQNFNPFVMKIQLDFSMDPKKLLDRRLGIAAAVLLCAIEGRQN